MGATDSSGPPIPSWVMSVLIFVLVVCLVVGVPDFVMKPLVAMGLIARKHKATARHILVKEVRVYHNVQTKNSSSTST